MAESERKKLKSEYSAWLSMRQRCNNPNCKNYRLYGGRGIKICDGWRTFGGFIKDMGKKPSPKHSLDRIDVNGDYAPNNCRWATQLQQVLNRRDIPNPNGFRGGKKKAQYLPSENNSRLQRDIPREFQNVRRGDSG